MRKFHLPENPNPEIIRKLDKNLRKDFFISKYGRLFQIELESLQAYAPERFKNIIIDSVSNILNKDKKYENMKKYQFDGLILKILNFYLINIFNNTTSIEIKKKCTILFVF